MNRIVHADNLTFLNSAAANSFDLIYVDPPFNTGEQRVRKQLRTRLDDDNGDRTGFHGRRFSTAEVGRRSWSDVFDDYMAFLLPRLEEAHRVLKDSGSLFVHLDYREVHYCKIALDEIFGRESFINEIVWAYDYGSRSKSRWPAKHDTILWFAKNPKDYRFDYEAMDRIPYMAPGLVTKEKAARGKTPTDVWWHTIVSPTSREKTGYPTQKPLGVLERIVKVHSNPGDLVLDFFAGSGTTGEAAARNDRQFVMVDENPEAIDIMTRRLAFAEPKLERLSDDQR